MSRSASTGRPPLDGASPLRVLHLMGSLRPSGMERMLVSAAEGFALEGIEGTVVGQGAEHSFVPELEAAGYPVRLVPPVRTIGGARALHGVIRSTRPDVVHVHTEGFFLPTVLLCVLALRSRRVVHTVHNVFTGPNGWRVRRRIQTAVADRVLREVVAPSPDVEENERGFGRRTSLVYNWVDRRFFTLSAERGSRPQHPGATRFLLLGNCNEAKNHETALRAVDATGGVVLHLGDESGASAEEQALLDGLERAGRLVSRGPQPPDVAMLDADAYLMPSRNEGMGVALAEAMTVGVPALIADAPGLHWAASSPGVVVVDLAQEAWDAAIAAFVAGERPSTGVQTIDFSPERGAREYAAVYRRAVG